MDGLWAEWNSSVVSEEEKIIHKQEVQSLSQSLVSMIFHNPTLLSPIKDEHGIDISLALQFLSTADGMENEVRAWLNQVLNRSTFTYAGNGLYPRVLTSYRELLEHPKRSDDEYKKEVTSASILYPVIALWAALLEDTNLFQKIASFEQEHLDHCNMQVWYPDEDTEEHLYTNANLHGAVLSHVPIEQGPLELLKTLWGECDQTSHFNELSVFKGGLWPIILVACRHYRLPVPPHFTLSKRDVLNGG